MLERSKVLEVSQYIQEPFAIKDMQNIVINGLPDSNEYEAFIRLAEFKALLFRTKFEADSNTILSSQHKLEAELNGWITSSDGIATMKNVVSSVGRFVLPLSGYGSVAHDGRHIVIKDPTAALTHITNDKGSIQPYQGASIIGSFLHDVGRLMEPRAYEIDYTVGNKVRSKHAKISFLFAQSILSKFDDIPPALTDQILYAVLTHQERIDDPSSLPPQRSERIPLQVKQADRQQLLGPEGCFRMITYNGGLHEASLISTETDERKKHIDPDGPYANELTYMIEYHMRRDPGNNFGKKAEEETHELKAMSGVFLWLIASDNLREIIFYPEFNYENDQDLDEMILAIQNKSLLPKGVLGKIISTIEEISSKNQKGIYGKMQRKNHEIKEKYSDFFTTQRSYKDIAKLFIHEAATPQGAVCTEELLRNLNSQIDAISEEEAQRLSHGILYLLASREILDIRERKNLEDILSSENKNAIEYETARIIYEGLESAEIPQIGPTR
ncbi:MAG TPA: hypothetical protein VLG12_05095 [Candidatus Saccharimonadales bacterium]|nr:hypothetical protein [Candidatus Saccharimonadales bacterium]